MQKNKVLERQKQEEKQRLFQNSEYKRKMYNDEVLNNKIEKKREQQELLNILNNQNIYKSYSSNEPLIKPYGERYETNPIDRVYTVGGFEIK